jgi:hypothetical protein
MTGERGVIEEGEGPRVLASVACMEPDFESTLMFRTSDDSPSGAGASTLTGMVAATTESTPRSESGPGPGPGPGSGPDSHPKEHPKISRDVTDIGKIKDSNIGASAGARDSTAPDDDQNGSNDAPYSYSFWRLPPIQSRVLTT